MCDLIMSNKEKKNVNQLYKCKKISCIINVWNNNHLSERRNENIYGSCQNKSDIVIHYLLLKYMIKLS